VWSVVAVVLPMAYRVVYMANVTRGCSGASHLSSWACGLLSALAAGCGSDGGADAGGDGALGGASFGGTGATATAGTGGTSSSGAGGLGSAGAGASGGSAGSEGDPDIGGLAGASGSAGTAGQQPAEPSDPRPYFSFFVTSQAGLFSLPAGELAPAPDPANGYGGNLGGLAGADEICTMLARASNPGDTKTWRAFLSTSGFNGGERVDAIDRVGPGPWYNYDGLLLAESVNGLLPQGNDGRPRDADPQLAAMFTDENGDDVRPNDQVDNHDTLTGSGADGRLFDDDEGGQVATCQDWTSSTLHGETGNQFGNGGQVPVGHSWPRGANNGRHWIFDHSINGCEPGALVTPGPGAGGDDFRVGAGGGYGGIYCFALGAVPPAAP
jgi:hypothetical protein